MNLTGWFQYGNRNTGSHDVEAVRPQGNGSVSTGSHSQQKVQGLTPGQTIQGEVISKNGNEVQIRMDRDVVITARLDRDMNLSEGQNMTFEVKNNSGVQIALRPLYENLAQDINVLKALEAAKLPNTNEMMRMVSSMMEQGMSIDRNTLLDMSKLIAANAGTAPEAVVMMKNMQIPITPENVQQFENYQSYKHQIVSNITDILLQIPQTYQTMVSTGQGAAATDFYMQLLQLFTGTQTMEPDAWGSKIFTDIAGTEGNTADVTSGLLENMAFSKAAGNPNTIYTQAQSGMADTLLEFTAQENQDAIMNQTDGAAGKNVTDNTLSQNGLLQTELTAEGRNQLAQLLGRLGAPEELLQQINSGSIMIKKLLADVGQLLSENAHIIDKTDIVQLFGSKEYNKLLSREILQQWLLKPEEVARKNDVETFYNRLREQTARLTEVLGQAAKDTPLAKSLTTMQNNIDFMNQVNQLFNYIQLPLKMSGGNAHGDLYVYTNRKSTVSEDGSVSALLHLDMENVGTMDIYVVMQEKNVSTKFYLANESMIDFVAAHIHMLNERLNKRGYAFHAEMLTTDELAEGNGNVMETLTKQQKKDSLVMQYSFDARA